jgi:GT2 family glycosyltransferase
MSGPPPRFSVIIPTFNRADEICGALEALGRLNPPPGGLEVVVVDDGSLSPLDCLMEPHRPRLAIQLHRQSNAGPAAARNQGARLARGEFLAFLDDDCQPEPDWLCALDQVFQQQPNALLGGRVVNGLRENVYSVTSQMIVDLAYRQFNPTPKTATFFCSNNFAMPVRRFLELGGFDDQNFRLAGGEDRDFCTRWRQREWRLRYVEDAVIRDYHRLSLGKFWKQCFHYGRGAWTYHRLEKLRGENSLVRDSGLHFNLPRRLFPLWRQLPWRSRLATIPLLAVWQLANLLGFFYQSWLEQRGARSPTAPDAV